MKKLTKEISLWRGRIDRIDSKLVALLNKRANYAEEIGKLKLKLGIEAYSVKREKEVMHNTSIANKGPLSDKAIKHLFKCIIDESRSLEHIKMTQIKKVPKKKI